MGKKEGLSRIKGKECKEEEKSKRFSKIWLYVSVWWLKPVILATWEAEIRRIMAWGQAGQKVLKTPISSNG
jgi:hypothetical protein